MTKIGGRYFIAGFCVLSFILAQAFQEFAYRFSIPASRGLENNLRAYLLPVDQARALAVGATILLLVVPYAVIALRYIGAAPVASVLGLIFSAAFVACEISYRSVETWHGSAPNITQDCVRRSIGIHFIPADARFSNRPGGYIYRRYQVTGSSALEESFFPLVWGNDGHRTRWIDVYLQTGRRT